MPPDVLTRVSLPLPRPPHPQELLLGVGGKAAWWSTFEQLLVAGDTAGLAAVTRRYMALLGLPEPDQAFLNKP